MAGTLRNVVVVGGSFVGMNAANELASLLPATHRVLLVEPHSHFHFLFAFPRFAITPNHEHKAFIPYTALFPPSSPHRVVQARATSISLGTNTLILDRPCPPHTMPGDRESTKIPFDYLLLATGTSLPSPGTIPHDLKSRGVSYLQAHQQSVRDARSIVIVGGGAVGVQMACDIAEVYGGKKEVTLVHSRERLMSGFHAGLDGIVRRRLGELGVRVVVGRRAVIPEGGFYANDGNGGRVEVRFRGEEEEGKKGLEADLVILATGQRANNGVVKGLDEELGGRVVNPKNGFVRVRPTMQFEDERCVHLFAVGDIADTGAQKAARPGMAQAAVAARNIAAMVRGEKPTEVMSVGPGGIHLTLGLTKNVIFRNPNTTAGDTEPFINLKDDGQEDMNIDSVWVRRGVNVASPQEYHL